MDSIRPNGPIDPGPRPQRILPPVVPGVPKASEDALQLASQGRSLRVEVLTQVLWMKQQVVFDLAPQADGSVVFTQQDSRGGPPNRRTLGMVGDPIDLTLDVQVRTLPWVNQQLRIEIHQDSQESRVRVSDPKSGKVLKEVARES